MRSLLIMTVAAALVTFSVGAASAADDTKVKSATRQVEEGAKTIGDGKVGTGAEETAKGVGNTSSRAASTRRQAEGSASGGAGGEECLDQPKKAPMPSGRASRAS